MTTPQERLDAVRLVQKTIERIENNGWSPTVSEKVPRPTDGPLPVDLTLLTSKVGHFAVSYASWYLRRRISPEWEKAPGRMVDEVVAALRLVLEDVQAGEHVSEEEDRTWRLRFESLVEKLRAQS